MKRFLVAVLVVGLIIVTSNFPVYGYHTNMSASVVVGQPDFLSTSLNQGGGSTAAANTLGQNRYTVVYAGKLIVADTQNNRVLIYNSIPTSNNASADVVVGQATFSGSSADQGGSAGANTLDNPRGIAVCNGRLVVAERNNNRVLIYNTIPTSNNTSADVVIGQTNFSNTNANQGQGFASANSIQQPSSVSCTSDKLIIGDTGNNRVLIFNSIPTSSNASADVVVGQTNFSNRSPNQGGSCAANTLVDANPYTDGQRLFVGDDTNARVLVFYSIPTQNNASADLVIGQTNFTSCTANQGGSAGGNTVGTGIRQIFFDGKRLFISDLNNNRVLIYNGIPGSNGAYADLVLGQTSFTASSPNQGGAAGGNTLNNLSGVISDGTRLFVNDTVNDRLLIFNNILSTPAMNIDSPIVQPEGKIRIAGNVSLGERPNYRMQKVTAVINGDGENNVTYLDGGRDNGPGNTLYEFYNDFNPTVNLGNADNYTIAFRAQSFNAEEDKVFYFLPFTLDRIVMESQPTITFIVNQIFRDQLKNNLIKYQVWYRKTTEKDFKLYLDNILTNQENNGKIVVKGTTKLLPGRYQIQLRAINTFGHGQTSNNLSLRVR